MTAATAGPATVATRTAYRDWLVGHMSVDERAICLDTDTGLFTGVDFGTAADRYVNLGIAEHNLIGVAAGLAASGWRPYVNTMAAFAATRALEAVKSMSPTTASRSASRPPTQACPPATWARPTTRWRIWPPCGHCRT